MSITVVDPFPIKVTGSPGSVQLSAAIEVPSTAAVAAAAASASAAAASAAAAAAVGTTTDAQIASRVGDSASATRAALSAKYLERPASSRVVDLVQPIAVAHMGGAFLAPEDTMEAYRAAAGYGADVLDADANLLLDGALGLMHDSTMDRTSTGTGNLTDQSATSFQQATIDAGTWFGGGWGNLKPPLLSQLFGEFGNKKVIQVEAKTQGAAAVALARDVARFGVRESVIVSTSFWADIPTLVASGAPTQYVMVTGTEQTPAAVAAAGCHSVCVPVAAAAMTSTLIGQFNAVGVQVWAYTVNRQVEVAAWVAKGGNGWYSDDPLYSKGAYNGYAYRVNKMPFATGAYYHGHQAGAALLRGSFSNGGWGWDDTTNAGARTLLAGAISPIKGNPAADTFTIDFSCLVQSQVDTGRWFGGFIGMTTDQPFSDNGASTGINGYRWLISGAGLLQLVRYTNGVADNTLISQATTSLTLPTTVTGQLIVTPTAISIKRTDVGPTTATSNVAAAQTYRGGYAWLAMSGTTGRFTRFEVTA